MAKLVFGTRLLCVVLSGWNRRGQSREAMLYTPARAIPPSEEQLDDLDGIVREVLL